VASSPDAVRSFLAQHHRTVLVTRRHDDRLQTSPVVAGVDGDGHVVVSATEDRAKVVNLRRDPRATLCAFTDDFFGPWVQADGHASIVPLPEALDGLVELYRRVAGEHEDWDEFARAMREEHRVLIRIDLDR
jgi:PPOX class probable F420-dependent enzyme